MYELKKNGKVFTSKSVGTGPSSYEKRIYRAAVSQRLRNTFVDLPECSVLFPYILKEYCQETEVFSRIKQEFLTDRKTSWMADLTVWLTCIMSWAFLCKLRNWLRRVVRLTRDVIYCTFLNEDWLILATLQNALGPLVTDKLPTASLLCVTWHVIRVIDHCHNSNITTFILLKML